MSRHLWCPRSGRSARRARPQLSPCFAHPTPQRLPACLPAPYSTITRHWQYQGTLSDHPGGRGRALSYASGPNLTPHVLLLSKQWPFNIRSGTEGLMHAHTLYFQSSQVPRGISFQNSQSQEVTLRYEFGHNFSLISHFPSCLRGSQTVTSLQAVGLTAGAGVPGVPSWENWPERTFPGVVSSHPVMMLGVHSQL